MKEVKQNLAKFEGKKVTTTQAQHLKGGGGMTVMIVPRSNEQG